MKTMATVKSYENEVNENYSITNNNCKTRTPTSRPQKQNTNDDVHIDDCVAYMHWVCTHCAFVPQLWLSHTSHSLAQVLSGFTHSSIVIFMGAPLWFVSPPVCPRFLLPPRAVPWAPLHDRHGKPALLRCRREWGHPELLHLSHRRGETNRTIW